MAAAQNRRALILCPEPPYPLRGGGAFRTASLVEYLGRNYALDAVFFNEETRPDPRAALPPGLVRETLLIPLPVHRRGWAAKAVRNARRYAAGVPPLVDRFSGFGAAVAGWLAGRGAGGYDLVVVEHLWCAPYSRLLRPHARKLVADLHNVESEWHARMAALDPWPLSHAHRRFAAAAARMESRLHNEFDMVLVTSERERLQPGLERALVYPNTIPAPPPAAPRSKARQIVFSGNLEYAPNISAVKWFGAFVWPRLASRYPDLEWVIAGRCPEAVRHALPPPQAEGARARIRLTGEVDDLRPEIARSLAAVVPLLSGSGTRVKILEAWAAGTAVVSTPLGAEGLPREGVALAANPDEFTGCLSALLDNETLRQDLSSRALALFNIGFTWEAGWKRLAANGI